MLTDWRSAQYGSSAAQVVPCVLPLISGRAALIPILELNQNRYKYFKWTPKTVRLSLIYVVIVPSIIGYLGLHYRCELDDCSSPKKAA